MGQWDVWNESNKEFIYNTNDLAGRGVICFNSDGTILAVGYNTNKIVRVFELGNDGRGGIDWSQLGSNIEEPDRNSAGYNVQLSSNGNVLIVSTEDAYNTQKTGSMIIYKYNGNDWIRNQEYFGNGVDYIFGTQTSINYDGRLIAVKQNSAKIRVFEKDFTLDNYNIF